MATCSRGKDLDVYTLPLDGTVPGGWSLERLRLEVGLSVRVSEQLLLYRHLLWHEPTTTRRRVVMMRLLRLHLLSDEFAAAQYYADKVKALRDPATAGIGTALDVWIEQRRAVHERERGRLAAEFVTDSRARFDRLAAGAVPRPPPRWRCATSCAARSPTASATRTRRAASSRRWRSTT